MSERTGINTPDNLGGFTRSHSTQVAAPGPYVRNGDFLRLNATSTDASATLVLNGRLLRPDGEIVPLNLTMPITGTGNQTAVAMPLVEGWIVGFIVFVNAGTITDGEIVASVDVVQAAGSGLTRVMCLASGEVTNTRSLGLGAYIFGAAASTSAAPVVATNAAANPGAGAELSWTVPASQIWEVQGVRAILTTSATVASREAAMTVDDGTNQFIKVVPGAVQTASLVKGFTYADIGSAYTAPSSGNFMISFPKILAAAGYRIATVTANIQVGDQWSSGVISYRQY